jgi:pyruvate dehydrogenase E2 component (dihydrolipoamide acetyltransferase)
MSVTVSMPQLGESVTEGTVTRWLKKEGEHVEVDEPLLEVSTDKVDTEIPSPASGILRQITVAEDETVAVGAQLAVIEEEPSAAAPAAPPGTGTAPAPATPEPAGYPYPAGPGQAPPAPWYPPARGPAPEAGQPAAAAPPQPAGPPAVTPPVPAAPATAPPPPGPGLAAPPPPGPGPAAPSSGFGGPALAAAPEEAPAPPEVPAPWEGPAPSEGRAQPPPVPLPARQPGTVTAPAAPAPPPPGAAPAASEPSPPGPQAPAAPGPGPQAALPGPYVTPLVRKLAAEHGVDLATVSGTGVGGRIRKQDVLEAARLLREQPRPAPAAADGKGAPARVIVPSTLRGTTERLSRARQLIARRMVESLHTSAQLTTVVEADVTAIARLRERARADFEAREGVKLSFLPFFALAAVEALKVHPKLNAVIDTEASQVTYHDAEHLGIAVDTERGLMVPVIRNAGDLNIGGLARKIADLAARARAGQLGPDELAGGTFTLTNTGSRGALFDTPIINQPQVGILGTGAVVKRPVVMEDPALGEVIAVRSVVYLALTYDHRLVDGADAARFLATVKERLEEGAFEAELGL